MATYIPAIQARMGATRYFVSTVTLGEAARLVQYVEEVDGWTPETPPELKLQRKLNLQRVERELVPYLLTTEDHFYSALTVEIRTMPRDGEDDIAFERQQSFPGGIEFGLLTLDGTERLCALDGQHRLKSIELAIRQQPELAREHITLVLIPFTTVGRSQTLFSDLNRYARPPSKSMAILFTHRELLARIAKTLASTVPLLIDRVNMESTSLSVNARHFITLSTLYEMTRALLVVDESGESAADEQRIAADQRAVWLALTNAIPEWRAAAAGEEHPAYLRQRYLHMHGVGQQAIAVALSRARAEVGDEWRRVLPVLGTVDWRLTNAEWQAVALHGGRVNNTATSVRLLAKLLGDKLGLTPGATASPRRSQPSAARESSG